jgi:hypothetical protein
MLCGAFPLRVKLETSFDKTTGERGGSEHRSVSSAEKEAIASIQLAAGSRCVIPMLLADFEFFGSAKVWRCNIDHAINLISGNQVIDATQEIGIVNPRNKLHTAG